MWKPRKPEYMQSSAYLRRSSSYIDKDFQLKYTKSVLIMAGVGLIIFLLPAFYYATQNYSIFLKLADLMNPEIANYIRREKIALNIAVFTAGVSWTIYWWILSKKMTAKIVGPLKILRNHIRLLSRGDFSLRPIILRDDDELKELINTYNYFYSILRVQNEKELSTLNNIQKYVENPVAQELVQELITLRKMRLNIVDDIPPNDLYAKPAAIPDSRHAS